MNKDERYSRKANASNVNSASKLFSEVEKLEEEDVFHMQQQKESPIYKKLSEEVELNEKQIEELQEQNKTLSEQLKESKRSSKVATRIAIASLIIAFISLIVSIVLPFILRQI